MSSPAERFHSEFEALSPSLPGLAHARRAAISRFAELGLPTARHEDWKYTRVTPLEKRSFSAETGDAPTLTPRDYVGCGLRVTGANVLAFVNGRHEPSLSSLVPQAGVSVKPLGVALASNESEVSPYVQADGNGVSAFTALNAAFVRDGVIVRVRPGTRVERPLHVRFLSVPGESALVAHPRLILDVGEDAHVDILESYTNADGGAHFNNVYADLRLARGAVVRHCKLHEEGAAGVHIATTRVHQAGESRYHSLSVALDGQLVRNDIECLLAGSGARCALHGLFIGGLGGGMGGSPGGGGRSHIDYHTRVDHEAPGASSDEVYRGVLGGRARGVFNGRVYVHRDAQQTQAHQKNDNLLLSRHAEIDTKPQLEIYADDVKCSHGATVGQLDADALHYLRTRGIGEQAARGFLVHGFASEVFRKLDVPDLADALEPRVLAHMPDANSIAEVLT